METRLRRPLVVIVLLAVTAAVGNSQTLQTLIDNGDSSNRVDIVFLGDGYTQDDLDAGLLTGHVEQYLDYLFLSNDGIADPFPRYRDYFNVHLIPLVSNESGADRPPLNDFRDTALDATYYSRGIERLLTVNDNKANAARNAALSGTGITADMQYVTVNDQKYGGAGGAYAVFAGGNSFATGLALHEVGHSFSNLADEYVSFGGDYPFGEPSEVNVTADPTGAKWQRWLGYDDPRGSNLDIGVIEGARYYPTGVYRPAQNGKMRSLDQAFHAVSREKIILDIYDHVDPLDDHTPTAGITFDPDELWVEPIASSILVDWKVNGVPSAQNAGLSFDVALEGLSPGFHTITATAYDEIIDHAFTGGPLDLVRHDFHELTQVVQWNVVISEPIVGDYNGDGLVDLSDAAAWSTTYGSTVSLAADGNGDGIVNSIDYTIWRDAYTTTTAVPAPATSLLAWMAIALITSRPRHNESILHGPSRFVESAPGRSA
ncbi:MAG: M64 family metallopeptidase [Planctomycetota bacterium]